jgi:glycosyltransferase involved in cell wall biosynthesis
MRVLHWYPNLLGGGAVANAVISLAFAQAALGAEVLIAVVQSRLAPSAPMPKPPNGFQLFLWKPAWQLGKGNLILRGLSFKDRQQLIAWLPDVVHIHGEFNPDNLRVPSLFRCPKVLSPHGAFHPLVLSKNRMWKSLYVALAKRMLYSKVAFYALSPLEKNCISEIFPPAEIYIYPNCLSPRMEENLATCSDCTVFPSESISFLFAGRLDVWHKGLDTLLGAFAMALQALSDKKLTLLLAGRDFSGGRKELQWLAQRLGIAAHVKFLGHLNEVELARSYESADLYVQLSRNEAFGLSAAEALLCGKPAILGDQVGLASYLEINRLPQVAVVSSNARSIAQAMIHAARNLGSLRQTAQANRTKIREFLSWRRVAGATLDEYRALGEIWNINNPPER